MEMNHLIGQRFNLISKSDIRYVGTLHEINPEASTIALENVMSFGSEGRRGNPAEEVPPSTSVYEYIVFRGSDVKDISIAGEDQKDPAPQEPPRVPDDPAILGGMQRPVPGPGPDSGPAPPNIPPQAPPQLPQGAGPTPPGYPQQQQFQQGYYPPYGQQRFGPPPPFPPGPGFPPYGAPPGWYPPPGHGFPPVLVNSNLRCPLALRPGPPGAAPAPKSNSELPVEEKLPNKPTSRNATPAAQNAPTPPIESKPTVAEALQGPVSTAPLTAVPQKNGRVMPAIPIAAPKPAPPTTHIPTAPRGNNQSITDATAAATAAVAAAMAKLPQPGAQKQPGQPEGVVDALAQQMNQMRPYDNTRGPRGGHHHPRGGRGGTRPQQQHKKIEVPQSDYDFQTANAKFNKQDLVKEAIATGVPALEAEAHAAEEAESMESMSNGGASSHHGYNRGSSFFDNISSEARDREENTGRVGGREWRGEEEKRNMETFGQGSVDGYRPNYRGRGRGRGYGRGRGGGGYSRGYGRGRGGRVTSESTGVPSQG
ncbi:Lsm14 N-terminal [Penicillium coprophilum]|uniref:Lsm14 N-terminal n=1 Tax=Penicillium coprophilum TaxID=36646 RepID=UPI00238AFFB0|nr:Lsm14 N-terminal [Penicillium coprophilum]KAJ5154894.1 Lsm14 N-terminal [Penicillium coprophilum]